MNSVVFRCDGSARMGTGHLMRSLALAQAFQAAGSAPAFLSANPLPTFEARLNTEKIAGRSLRASAGTQEDAAETVALAQALGAEWIAVDGYQFGAPYQRAIKSAGLRLIWIDDHGHAGEYCADLILNQNACASEKMYARRDESVRLLLGTEYALLRREFCAWKNWKREIAPIARKILVTLGGSDPDNVTCRVIDALKTVAIEDIEIRIVVGGSNPFRDEIEKRAAEFPSASVLSNVSDMPAQMGWADLCVAAAGSTVYELACMGLPCLSVVLADNQAPLAEALATRGTLMNAGWHGQLQSERLGAAIASLAHDCGRRRGMSTAGRARVDGYGGERVVQACVSGGLTLRSAADSDCRQIWEWANDPEARANSFAPGWIPFDQHEKWYHAKLNDPDSEMFIAEFEGKAAGLVRFDPDAANAGEFCISINVASEQRGRGLGHRVIRAACRAHFAARPGAVIHAHIKPENAASIKTFERAGFRRKTSSMIRGCPALHYTLSREESR